MERVKNLDWVMVFIVWVTACLGLGVQYSSAGGSMVPWALHQAILLTVSTVVMLAIALMNTKSIYNASYWMLFLCILMLVLVFFFGSKSMGASRWINLGLVKIQPSEITKLAMVLALARYFDRTNLAETSKITNLVIPLILISVLTLLILKQPNLGTAVVLIMIAVIVAYAAGVKIIYFVFASCIALISVPIIWNMLYDYQKKRVLTFLDPEKDPLGSGYNIIQSKIAIGSGGLIGKGFLFGSQTQLKFLPEKHTDFAFTVFAEEIGFMGTLVYFSLYTVILIKGLSIAKKAINNDFNRLAAVGVTALLFVHFIINIGMVAGVLPVVGVPLPLMSYGGSIMITTMAGIGILLNVDAQYTGGENN